MSHRPFSVSIPWVFHERSRPHLPSGEAKCVAKMSKRSIDGRAVYFAEVRMQAKCQALAKVRSARALLHPPCVGFFVVLLRCKQTEEG